LDQINTENVQDLEVRWVAHTGIGEDPIVNFATNPIIVDGVMFVTDPGNAGAFGQNVLALDAATGEQLWRRTVEIQTAPDILGLFPARPHRGAAVGDGKVFVATLDARLWALDALTGEPVADFGDGAGPAGSVQVADPEAGYFLTMAPLVIPAALVPPDGPASGRNLVILGISGAEFEIRGFVSAYDADSGELLWRFFTVPAPDEFGGDTWPSIATGPFADPFTRGGGSVWQPPAYDPEAGLLIFGTGNAGPDFDGTHRAGANLFTASVVALDIASGERVWHFQEVHHDLWDYDQGSAPVLFTVEREGQSVKAVGAAGKTGWFYILDRETGEPLIACPERPVSTFTTIVAPDGTPEEPFPTQPFCESDAFVLQGDRVLPSGRYAQPIFTPPGPPREDLQGPPFVPFLPPVPISDTIAEPGFYGGSEWSPVSYHPGLGLAFIAGDIGPMTYTAIPEASPSPGRVAAGGHWSFTYQDVVEDFSGLFTAMDVATGRIRWQQPSATLLINGSCATAGGLVFIGEAERNPDDPAAPLWFFTGFDAETGDRLFRFPIPGNVSVGAPCVSYAVDGEQFIAVAVGGSWARAFGGHGDTIYAFALPE
jgi:glucose dehydrogenase